MIVNNLGKFPLTYDYYGDISALDEHDLNDLKKIELCEIWYWYGQGSYDGAGQILMRKKDLYDTFDLSHCSCYGPTENVEFHGKPLDKIAEKVSSGYMNEIKELLEMAGLENEARFPPLR